MCNGHVIILIILSGGGGAGGRVDGHNISRNHLFYYYRFHQSTDVKLGPIQSMQCENILQRSKPQQPQPVHNKFVIPLPLLGLLMQVRTYVRKVCAF